MSNRLSLKARAFVVLDATGAPVLREVAVDVVCAVTRAVEFAEDEQHPFRDLKCACAYVVRCTCMCVRCVYVCVRAKKWTVRDSVHNVAHN